MQKAAPRLLIAGTNSGCGKTTVTCAILQALVDGGVSVAVDYNYVCTRQSRDEGDRPDRFGLSYAAFAHEKQRRGFRIKPRFDYRRNDFKKILYPHFQPQYHNTPKTRILSVEKITINA